MLGKWCRWKDVIAFSEVGGLLLWFESVKGWESRKGPFKRRPFFVV